MKKTCVDDDKGRFVLSYHSLICFRKANIHKIFLRKIGPVAAKRVLEMYLDIDY